MIVWSASLFWLIPINFWSRISSPARKSNYTFNDFTAFYNDTARYNEFKCETSFEKNKSFKIITTIFNFYVPLLGIIYIYSKIFMIVRSRSKSEWIIRNQLKAKKMAHKSPSFKNSNRIDSNSIKSDQQNRLRRPLSKQRTLRNPLLKELSQSDEIRQSLKLKYRRNAIGKFNLTRSSEKTHKSTLDLEVLGQANNGIEVKFKRFCLVKQDSVSPGLKHQIRAARQLGFLLLAFLSFWMPYFFIFLVVAFCSDCIPEHVSTFCVWLGYINSACNPILYPLCNNEFKIAFRKMFGLAPIEPTRRDLIKIMSQSKK